MASYGRRPRLGVRVFEWLAGRRPGHLVLGVILLVPVGTIGFALVEDLSLLDAVYQTVITLSTVGYSDFVTTDTGRVFNIFFMAVGVGVFVMMLSSLAALLMEGRMREAIGRRRMERQIEDLRDHIVLCGFGRFGEMTVADLERRNVPVALLESDPAKVELAEERGLLVLHADATEEASLERAGIEHAKGVISTLGSDAANVYVALTAKQLCPEVPVVTIAREAHAESKLRAAGADHVFSPYRIGGLNLARRILQPHLSDFLDGVRSHAVRLEEIAIRTGSRLVHARLRDTELRGRYGVTVVAVVKTRTNEVRYNPEPDLELEAGDVLVAVGSAEALHAVEAECATPGPA